MKPFGKFINKYSLIQEEMLTSWYQLILMLPSSPRLSDSTPQFVDVVGAISECKASLKQK